MIPERINSVPLREEVWAWRDDRKRWEIKAFHVDDQKYFGHPEYAYTYWCKLIYPPIPPGVCHAV